MATFKADNYSNIAHMGAYGNLSNTVRTGTVSTAIAAADTIDLCTLPGGAKVVSGFFVLATAITTSTWHFGVRYSDGTSTGGTTGTAVISGTGISAPVANAQNQFQFLPFTNDVDTILYATFANGAAPGAGIKYAVSLAYEATGTK